MDYDPPFLKTYKTLLGTSSLDDMPQEDASYDVETCNHELPLIDLGRLKVNDRLEREECMEDIAEATRLWGFFQVVNHGISLELLKRMHYEQVKVFHETFVKKSQENFMNLPAKSYRWGNPAATNPKQLIWSEAFHMRLTDISKMNHEHNNLRSTIEACASDMGCLAERLAEILGQKLGVKSTYFQETCSRETCYLRLNRYPPCPLILSRKVFGLLPHSDTSFLSVVHQDHVGGLQLMKEGKWFHVKPNPDALLVNIGDLFQALSNGFYESRKHRVMPSKKTERFSVVYFYCPSLDATITSYGTPPVYRTFNFREYKLQTEKDVKEIGDKVGLSRFLL